MRELMKPLNANDQKAEGICSPGLDMSIWKSPAQVAG